MKQLLHISILMAAPLMLNTCGSLTKEKPCSKQVILIEAESVPNRTGVFQEISDSRASGNKALKATVKGNDRMESNVYDFDVQRTGLYYFWMRAKFLGYCANTFYVAFNDQPKAAMQGSESFDQWVWIEGPQAQLNAGKNVLAVYNREAGAAYDMLLLTQDEYYAPQGKGEKGSHICDFSHGVADFITMDKPQQWRLGRRLSLSERWEKLIEMARLKYRQTFKKKALDYSQFSALADREIELRNAPGAHAELAIPFNRDNARLVRIRCKPVNKDKGGRMAVADGELKLRVRQEYRNTSNISDIDPNSFLVAFHITPQEEEEWLRDSGATPFWQEWSIRRLPEARLHPSLEKNVGWDSVSEGFRDEFDAQMTVRAAYGEKGVYFRFDVIDDDYPGDKAHWISWVNDNAEAMIDDNSVEELYANPKDHFIFDRVQITSTHDQFQCGMGGCDRSKKTIRVTKYDLEKRLTVNTTGTFTYRDWPLDSARDSLGILVEVHCPNNMRRTQEWLIPWNQIGMSGMSGCPPEGTKKAVMLSYNDYDTLSMQQGSGSFRKLTWGGRGSPYDLDLKRTWGDLLFGPWLRQADYTFEVIGRNDRALSSGALDSRSTGFDYPKLDAYNVDLFLKGYVDFDYLIGRDLDRIFLNGKEVATRVAPRASTDTLRLSVDKSDVNIRTISVADTVLPEMYENFFTQRSPKWVKESGRWTCVRDSLAGAVFRANPLRQGEQSIATSGKAYWADYRLQVAEKATNERTIGILSRYRDAKNYYSFTYNPIAHQVTLAKEQGGNHTILAHSPQTLVSGEWYRFAMELHGKTIEGHVNDEPFLEVTDTSIDCGRIGLYSDAGPRGSAEAALFDDVFVEPQGEKNTIPQDEIEYGFDEQRIMSTNFTDWYAGKCACKQVSTQFIEFDNNTSDLRAVVYKREVPDIDITLFFGGDVQFGSRDFSLQIGMAREPNKPESGPCIMVSRGRICLAQGGKTFDQRRQAMSTFKDLHFTFRQGQMSLAVAGQTFAFKNAAIQHSGYFWFGFRGTSPARILLDYAKIAEHPGVR